jgi:hypothetical protein
VDFIINPQGTVYQNGTQRGEASYNGGNPQISFNIDIVSAYADLLGGLNYIIGHEIGHMTEAGRAGNREVVANDIARAIDSWASLDILSNPGGGGYGTTYPLTFSQPSGGGGTGTKYDTYEL